jgi:uncharacterized protein (DUF58 family)
MTLPPAPLAEPSAVRRLQLDVARRLDGLLQGDHLGFLPGPGSDPAEARTYAPGDDVRRIDWSLTARTGETHVRTTDAERELETTLLVDLSASMSFGTAGQEKRDLAVAVAAAFLHLSDGPGDRTGAMIVAGDRLTVIPPRGGRAAGAALLRRLISAPRTEGPGRGLNDALHALAARPRRRGFTVVVSDLLDDGWQRPLRKLALHSDVLVAQVVDRRELALPGGGVLSLVDPETGQALRVRATRALQERYAAAAAERAESQRAAVRAAGASHLLVTTGQDWLPVVARALALRRRTRGVS